MISFVWLKCGKIGCDLKGGGENCKYLDGSFVIVIKRVVLLVDV